MKLNLGKLMKAIANSVPYEPSAKTVPSQTMICEECGEFVERLKLTKEGFFHCEPCDFMYVRRKAVQDFDSE